MQTLSGLSGRLSQGESDFTLSQGGGSSDARGGWFSICRSPYSNSILSDEEKSTLRFSFLLKVTLIVALVTVFNANSVVSAQDKVASAITWSSRTIEGWKVNVNEQLEKDDSKLLATALDLLSKQLQEIVRVVPPGAVKQLREVTLWISPEYPGVGPQAEYHPGAGWLRDNGRDPAMVKGVEFTNVRIFEAETRRMPNLALHELAHAYHDQVLGNDHKELIETFERAKAGGKYNHVERQDSEGRKSQDRAYALTSPQEYFAETSEAYFSKNDFQPYDRAELEVFDPAMYKLLESLWR